jgi:asparagine synthetase B (glutamine-hydrolysing)
MGPPPALHVCGVIARARASGDQLRSWYREALVDAPVPSVLGSTAAVAASHVERSGDAFVGGRYQPMYWSPAGYEVGWKPELVRADDDCTVVVTGDEVSLRSSGSGGSTMFVHRTPEYVAFAPSISQLAAARHAPLDQLGIAELLRFGAGYTRRTLLEGVERVPFGHSLTITLGRADDRRQVETYDRDADPRMTATRARAETSDALRAALAQLPEHPALLFSGGVDSTVLAQTMQQLDRPFSAYMVSLHPDDPEPAHAAAIARHLGVSLTTIPLTLGFDDVLATATSYAVPTVDFSVLPTLAAGRRALAEANGPARVLDGTGGDAWFGFGELANATIWRRLQRLAWLRGLGSSTFARFATNDGARALRPLKVLARIPRRPAPGLGHLSATPLYGQLLSLQAQQWEQLDEELLALWHGLTAGRPQDDLSQLLVMDATLIATARFAAKTSQWSLSARAGTFYPYLSPGVRTVARRLPASLLVSGGTSKPVLKDLMAHNGLPSELARRPKSGFQPPLLALLQQPDVRGPLLERLDGDTEVAPLLTEYARELPRRLLAAPGELTVHTLNALWGITALTLWVQALRAGELSA